MSWIDLLIIFIYIVCIIFAYKRGLILTITSLLSFFVSLIFSNIWYKDLANYITSNTGIVKQMNELIPSFENNKVIQTSVSMNEAIVDNIPQGARDYIQQVLYNGNGGNTTAESSNYISSILIHIVSFLIIFFVVRFVIHIVARAINSFSKLPVLNFFNKIGGAFLGMVQGTIINMITISVIYTIAIFGGHVGFVNGINNSIMASYFYIGYIFY